MSRASRLLAAVLLAALVLAPLESRSLMPDLLDLCAASELEAMARSYGLDPSGSQEDLRARLKAFWLALCPEPEAPPEPEAQPEAPPEPEPPPEAEKKKEGRYSLQIENCSRVTLDEGAARMEGDVRLSFEAEGEGPRSLEADEVVMEIDNKILAATGGAVFKDEGKGSRQVLRGDMVSYNWETGSVNLTGGGISSVRTNNEGRKIEFHATGSTISYLGKEDVVVLDDGRIATRASDPYWGIASRKTALLDNGDLFIFNATLNLGRIPVLWTPAFFYSGSRLVFNPALGLASDRGMFLNTTTELYGTFKVKEAASKEGSSFAALLRTSEEGAMERGPIIYRKPSSDAEPSPLERWAKETGSHMALLADVYEKGGVFLGLESENSFASKRIKLDFFGGVARDFAPRARQTRFFEVLSGKVDMDRVRLSFSLPYHSDGEAAAFYGNRLSSFTLDSLLGESAKFPSDMRAVNSFEWKLEGSASAPTGWAGKLIKRAEISSLDILLKFGQKSSGGGLGGFEVRSAKVPGFSTYVGGTLADLSSSGSRRPAARPGDGPAALAREMDARREALDAAGGPKSPPPFLAPRPAQGDLGAPRTYSNSLQLSYDWKQKFSNDLENLDREPERRTGKVYYKTDGTLSLKTRLGDRLFSLDATVAPSYERSVRDGEATDAAKVAGKLAASVPAAGLTYKLDWRLLDYKKGAPPQSLVWDRSAVGAHSLAFALPLGPFRLSLSQTLPPTRMALTAAASFKAGGFGASVSQKFKEKDKALEPSALALDLSYGDDALKARVGAGCDFSREGDVWRSFKLDESLSWRLWKEGPRLSQSLKLRERFEPRSLDFGFACEGLALDLGLGPEPGGGLRAEHLDARIDVARRRVSFWKGRVAAELTLKAAYSHNFLNHFASGLRASVDLKLAIAEFLDVRFSASSANNSFYRYYDAGGRFVLSSLLEDLARSFDFAGDGRRRTGFNLSAIDAEAVHYMKDWDFHCKYKGGVVLSKGSWNWKESVSFYVQWGAIPDIKTERTEEW